MKDSSPATGSPASGGDFESAALQRPSWSRYGVLGLLSTMAAVAYFERQLISVVAGPFAADLELSDTELGTVMSGFYAGYALFQIPSGQIADRWGTRRALTAFALLWSLSAAAMALSQNYASAAGLWFIAGSAQAGAFPCAASALRVWMPLTRRAFASGMLSSCMSLGGAASAYTAGKLLGEWDWDWRTLFILFAVPGLAWAGIFAWWFRNAPEEHSAANAAERELIGARSTEEAPAPHRRAPSGTWTAMLTSLTMWAICAQQFFRAAGYIFFATWFPTYLHESRGLSLSEAGAWTSLPLLAVVVGSPAGGIISDWLLVRTGRRRLSRCLLSAACMGLCATMIMTSYLVADARAAVAVISAGSCFAAIGGVSAYTITMDLGGKNVATMFSVMNMCGNIGAAILPPCIGFLVARTGGWELVLPVFAAIYAAAAVSWLVVDPQRPIFANA